VPVGGATLEPVMIRFDETGTGPPMEIPEVDADRYVLARKFNGTLRVWRTTYAWVCLVNEHLPEPMLQFYHYRGGFLLGKISHSPAWRSTFDYSVAFLPSCARIGRAVYEFADPDSAEQAATDILALLRPSKRTPLPLTKMEPSPPVD
jgi:hypothetical protein